MSEPQNPQELREKYRAALGIVWKKPDNCPICDSTFWNLGDVVESPLRHPAASDLLSLKARQVYVYVPVTCIYCGYTIFFHTGILDVRLTEDIKAVPPLRAPEESQ